MKRIFISSFSIICSLALCFFGLNLTASAKSLGDIYGYNNLGICNIAEGNINIREQASSDSKLVGQLPANAGCEIVQTVGEWSLIKSGDVEGYVISEYLLTGDAAWDKAVELAEYIATSTTGGLRVRAESNTDCDIIYQLSDGEEVTIIENTQDNEWIKVQICEGVVGYVCAEYVDVDLSLKTAIVPKIVEKRDRITKTNN